MNRFLTSTAVALVLGLTPALAQTPTDEAQTPPAMQDPAQPSEAVPSEPSKPAAPLAGETSEPDAVPGQSSEMMPSSPDEASPPAQSSEAPDSIMPPSRRRAPRPTARRFLSKQESNDLLASSLIGQSVVNSQDETIGDINDLVTDESGKVIAVLVGTGGFLGIGEKDVALGFEDLRFVRDENDAIKVIANVSQETLASAPDYRDAGRAEGHRGREQGRSRGPGPVNSLASSKP